VSVSFVGLVLVCTVAFVAPLLLGLVPKLRLPAVVLEILAGIAIGPSGLGWVAVDEPIRVLSLLGLAFLLFLAGLELDVRLLRGRRLQLTVAGFVLSIVLAYAIAAGLRAIGMVESALLVAICLSATALGVVAPVLKDAGESAGEFGQLIIAAASIADFGTILMLSLLFSREEASTPAQLVLMGGFVLLTLVIVGAMTVAERSSAISTVLARLQDSTAQIRVRGAFLLMVGFTAMAARLGLELILGAFVAGALLAVLDADYQRSHPKFHEKLEAIGFGVFVPVFFVTSGLRFDVAALFEDSSTLLRVPIFLVALLVVRGLPALLYRPLVGRPRAVVAALLQATSLPFIVAATTIGIELNAMARPNASALVAAGLLSVVIFPMSALALLRRAPASPAPAAAGAIG
jgi:Kef-type K+ transport system membrane component KefB